MARLFKGAESPVVTAKVALKHCAAALIMFLENRKATHENYLIESVKKRIFTTKLTLPLHINDPYIRKRLWVVRLKREALLHASSDELRKQHKSNIKQRNRQTNKGTQLTR